MTATDSHLVTHAMETGERLIAEAFAALTELSQAAMAGLLEPAAVRRAMQAKAKAAPWLKVKEAVSEGDPAAAAIRAVRFEATNLLVEQTEARGTCEIDNAAARMEREGYRKFLRTTLLATIQDVLKG